VSEHPLLHLANCLKKAERIATGIEPTNRPWVWKHLTRTRRNGSLALSLVRRDCYFHDRWFLWPYLQPQLLATKVIRKAVSSKVTTTNTGNSTQKKSTGNDATPTRIKYKTYWCLVVTLPLRKTKKPLSGNDKRFLVVMMTHIVLRLRPNGSVIQLTGKAKRTWLLAWIPDALQTMLKDCSFNIWIPSIKVFIDSFVIEHKDK